MVIKEGYAALSSRVAATLDIRLNTEVKTIRLDDAQSNVEVVVSNEGKTTSFRAGYVVVTLPLGVLKSRLVRWTNTEPATPYPASDQILRKPNSHAICFRSDAPIRSQGPEQHGDTVYLSSISI